jgi:hypothetical protein
MSTRASIIIKDEDTKLFFYRHSDGYPECCGDDLKDFVKGYSNKFRNNAEQSAGHLILHGHFDYKKDGLLDGCYEWKVGAYEPASKLYGDVEYIYVIDLVKGTLETRVPKNPETFWDKPTLGNTKLIKTHKFKVGKGE